MSAPDHTQTLEAKAAYEARWKRVMDCVGLRQPDRMPVTFMPAFWLAKYGGISYKELMYDYAKTRELTEKACVEFEPDAVSPAGFLSLGPLFEVTGFQQFEWPGHGVGDNQPMQFLDREYMTAEEYDEFLFDPTGFYLSKYLPRVGTAFNGLAPFASLTGTFSLETITTLLPFGAPEIGQAMERLAEAARENQRYVESLILSAQRLAAMGFPMSAGSTTLGAYDNVADFFRGATGTMKDMFRHKEKLLQVIDKVRILGVRKVLARAKMTPNPICFIPVHWAPDAYMSQKQFETFWWPSFRQMLLDLIEGGLNPLVLWESDCTKRLETIRDVPPGKCIYWFERTDMVRAHEVLGDVVALRGGLSASLLVTGTPDDVDAAVKHLVDHVWNKGGKLMLDCGVGVPSETRVENVRAMFDAARKYGG